MRESCSMLMGIVPLFMLSCNFCVYLLRESIRKERDCAIVTFGYEGSHSFELRGSTESCVRLK